FSIHAASLSSPYPFHYTTLFRSLLEHAGGRVGAVEDRDVAGLDALLVGQPVDLLGHEPGLVVLVVGHVAHDLGAVALVGPEVLRLARLVAPAYRGGGGQDVLRRAVVLLQQDRAGVGVVALELQDVADRRTPERVDRLVGVAHHAQLRLVGAGADLLAVGGAQLGVADQLADQHVLGVV